MNESKQGLAEMVSQKKIERRRFVRVAGLALPAAMTISARSALACTCSTVSAHASIKLAESHNSKTDVNIACNGKSPDYYKMLSDWRYVTSKDDLFNGQFPGSGLPDSATMKKVLKNIVKDAYGNPVSVSNRQRIFAAAYLNSKNGYVSTTFYTIEEDLKKMWSEGPLNAYHPVPGASWGNTEIETYLTDTWT